MIFYDQVDPKYFSQLEKYYDTVASFKTWDHVLLFFNLSKFMEPNCKILIVGSGQGFEALCFNLFLPNSQIDLIDNWSEPNLHRNNEFYRNRHIDNTKENFLKNCNLFNVNFNIIECDFHNIEDRKIKIKDKYDIIYYNVLANTQPSHKDIINGSLNFLWDILNNEGILFGGGGYFVDRKDFRMTPLIDQFCIDKNIEIQYYKRNWILEKQNKDILCH